MGGKQLCFSNYEQTNAKKQNKREKFLSEMEVAVPWQTLISLIEPHYPKTSSKSGRPWHFSMKVHAGIDKDSSPIHSVIATPANAQGWKARQVNYEPQCSSANAVPCLIQLRASCRI